MWDDSLPAYTGSFSDNIIVLTICIKICLYYIVLVLGIIAVFIISILPFIGIVLGYKSVIIKIKQDKHHKKLKKKRDKEQQIKQHSYITSLDRQFKKKKKHR